MRIFVIGHNSPDLDTTAAAIAYARFLVDAKRYPEGNVIPVIAGDINKETKFALGKAKIEVPMLLEEYELTEEDRFILVDHNEEAQRHAKIMPDQIIEIVDHHKSNISFTNPLKIDFRPLGSTSTIVHELFQEKDIKLSEGMATLLLCAILSDTQGLKSSTTTGIDSQTAHELSEEFNLDLEELTFEIFKAKSDISDLTIKQLVEKDYKIFDFGENKVFINQIETVEPMIILNQKEEIIEAMEEVKAKLGVSQAYTVVTDILGVSSQVLYTTDEEKKILERAFTGEGADGVIDIGPQMSRKKDIAPKIERVLTS
jgi:manganese-dependent inorganic pyrophosphatase